MTRNYVFLVALTTVLFNALLKESNAQIMQPVNCILFQGCICSLQISRYYDIQCTSSEKPRSPFPIRNNSTALPSPLINLLLFKNYNFNSIPNRIFQDLEIESLFFNDNNLQNITIEAFASVKRLRFLNVYEKMLNIESGVFRTLNGLEELSLSGQLTDEKLELMRNDLANFKRLTSLSFALNNLTTIDPTLIQPLSELMSLDLSQNNLKNLSADLLKNFTKLRLFSLSFNPLNDSESIFNALRPVKSTLNSLFLKSCQIDNIGNMSEFLNLSKLDLSSNRISKLNNRLDNLMNLTDLILSNNKLEDFDTQTRMLRKLSTLDLKNNFINKIPNITELSEMTSLILNNQNGKLQTIQHYAFDRMMPTKKLNIDLRSNQITKIENKAFCSKSIGQRLLINRIQLNYASARAIEKCHLKQLNNFNTISSNNSSTNNNTITSNNDTVTIDIEGMDNTINLVCSCDFKDFATRFRIKLVGNCSLFNEGSCSNFNRTWLDDCETKPHLVCGNTVIDEKSGGGSGGGSGQNGTSSSGCLNIHFFYSGSISYFILLNTLWVLNIK